MSDVFQAVKRLISRSGMSVDLLAFKSGVTPQTIHNWLEGRVHEARVENLIKVASVFGKTVMLTGGELRLEPIPDTPASVAAKLNQAREFVGYWRRWQ
jgi:transcriptional regulator with XRE-family HTH domain